MHPHIERGGELRVERHDSDWIIQRYIIREHGLTLAGLDPKYLIDPIGAEDLQCAVLDLLGWWDMQLADPARLRENVYQAYAILTMCRILYTLEHGTVVSKPAAARWAQEKLGDPWKHLIELALRHEVNLNDLGTTMEFIHFTLDRTQNPA